MNRSRILIDQVMFCKLCVVSKDPVSFRILQLLLTVARRSPTHPTTSITVQRVLIYSLCECFNIISRLNGLHDVSSRIFYKFKRFE